MKGASYGTVSAMATLLLTTSISSMLAAGEAENPRNMREGVAIHRGRETIANKKAQWSADPEHGWVRTDDSHRTQGRYDSASSATQKTEKRKGNGKQKVKKIK